MTVGTLNTEGTVLLRAKVLHMCLKDAHRKADLFQLNTPENENKGIISRRKAAETSTTLNLADLEKILSRHSLRSVGFDSILKESKNLKLFERYDSSGLWIYPSLFNHSCSPNTSYFQLKSVMLMVATQDIAHDQELFVTYIDPILLFEERQSQLKNWGFKCQCNKCSDDSKPERQLEQVNAKKLQEFYDKKKNIDSKDVEKMEGMFATLNIIDKLALWPQILVSYIKINAILKYYESFLEFVEEYRKMCGLIHFELFLIVIKEYFDLLGIFGIDDAKTLRFKDVGRLMFEKLFGNDEKGYEYLLQKCCERMDIICQNKKNKLSA